MDHQIIDIDYDGQPLHITALIREEGDHLVYDCYTGDVLLGTVAPTYGDYLELEWTGDGMPWRLVKLIGEEIERQDR